MATIAAITVNFALPENDERRQNVTIGQSQDGTFKFYKYRTSDRIIVIPLRGLTTAIKDSLISALEADADYTVTIDPDAPVDLGAGSGTAVTAKWDGVWNFTKTTHDFWQGQLRFTRVS